MNLNITTLTMTAGYIYYDTWYNAIEPIASIIDRRSLYTYNREYLLGVL